MRNDVYKITKEIIKAPLESNDSSIKSAKEIFYGKDGFNLDYDLYYKSLMSNFSVEIQSLIRKLDNDLYFNLLDNLKDLWKVCFIGEFVYDEMIKKYNKEISTTTEIERIDEINNIVNTIENRLNDVYLIKSDFILIDPKNENKIKKALLMVQKIKDSLMHNDINNRTVLDLEESKIDIYNIGGRFPLEISIPIQYISGFIHDNIRVREEDKYISEDTDNLVFPIVNQINNIPNNNFFELIDSKKLNYLLKLFNNDILTIYKMPSFSLILSIDYSEKLIEVANDKNILFELEEEAYSYHCIENTIKLIEKYGKDIVKRFPNNIFKRDYDSVVKTIDIYGLEDSIHLLDNEYRIQDITYMINKYGMDTAKKLSDLRNGYITQPRISILEQFLEEYDIDTVTKIPLESFYHFKEIKKLINEFGIDIVGKMPCGFISAADYTIELNKIIKIEPLLEDIVEKTNNKKTLEYYGLNELLSIKRRKKTYNYFYTDESVKGLYYLISKYGYDNIKNNLTGDILFMYSYDHDFIDEMIKKYGIEIINYCFSSCKDALKYSVEEVKKIPYIINVDYEIGKKCIEKYGMDYLSKLDINSFTNTMFDLLFTYGKEGFNEVLDFTGDTITAFIEKYGINNISYFPKYIFSSRFYPESRAEVYFLIEYLLYYTKDNENLKKLIPVLFSNLFNYTNFKTINDCITHFEVINENLEEVSLDKEVVKKRIKELNKKSNEIILEYNEVMTKSVFGIDNPKVIALYIYICQQLCQNIIIQKLEKIKIY